ncbi:prolyl oligopeptidase family serine peptidase [Spirillospora sp. NPDC049024]
MSRTLTPELICALSRPEEVSLSAAGDAVAWTAVPNGTATQNGEGVIWTALPAGDAQPVTWESGTDNRAPRWAPRGATLAFLSDRESRGVMGLYMISEAAREAVPLHVPEQSISQYVWAPCGRFVACLRASGVSGGARSVIEIVDVGRRRVARRIEVASYLTALTWSPDSQAIAFIGQPDQESDSGFLARIGVVEIDSGAVHWVCAAPWACMPVWLEYGDTIAYRAPCEAEPLGGETVWVVGARPGSVPRIVGPGENGTECVVAVRAVQPATVVTALAVRLDSVVRAFDLRLNEWRDVERLDGDLLDLDVCGSGRIAAVAQTRSSHAEVWSGPPGHLVQRSDHGAALADVRLGAVSSYVSTSTDGWEIDVVAITPPSGTAGPHPTVVLPHGGPYRRSNLGVHCSPQDWGALLAASGYLVLMPNYRGGLGRGHRFAAAARGDVGGAEWDDVESALERAIALGLADPERLAIGGWSQGGYLAAWAITRTRRFKAAIMGAGVADWRALIRTSDKPMTEAAFVGAGSWLDGDERPVGHATLMRRRSPLSHSHLVCTPVLILHGESDRRIPVDQAVAFDRALRAAGVDVQMVTYPREPHVLREKEHQIDVMRRVLAWLDRHMRP